MSYQLQISAIMIKYLIVRSCSGLPPGRAHGRPQELAVMDIPAHQAMDFPRPYMHRPLWLNILKLINTHPKWTRTLVIFHLLPSIPGLQMQRWVSDMQVNVNVRIWKMRRYDSSTIAIYARETIVVLGLSGFQVSTRMRITRIMTYKQDAAGARGY